MMKMKNDDDDDEVSNTVTQTERQLVTSLG